jgi:hypothetical protein
MKSSLSSSLSESLLAALPAFAQRSRRSAAWALPLALVFGLASAAHAAAIVIPPGLNPGDTYRIIFVTSNTSNGSSANIANYNNFVTIQANLDAGLAGLGTTWTALASTAAVNVLTNTGLSAADTTTPFYNTAGNLIATGVRVATTGLYGLQTTAHQNIILLASGSFAIGSNVVFTGTMPGGASSSSPLGSSTPSAGRFDSTNSIWTFGVTRSASDPARLYGISGVLTVPTATTPEPSSLALLGSALLALGLAKLRGVRK